MPRSSFSRSFSVLPSSSFHVSPFPHSQPIRAAFSPLLAASAPQSYAGSQSSAFVFHPRRQSAANARSVPRLSPLPHLRPSVSTFPLIRSRFLHAAAREQQRGNRVQLLSSSRAFLLPRCSHGYPRFHFWHVAPAGRGGYNASFHAFPVSTEELAALGALRDKTAVNRIAGMCEVRLVELIEEVRFIVEVQKKIRKKYEIDAFENSPEIWKSTKRGEHDGVTNGSQSGVRFM